MLHRCAGECDFRVNVFSGLPRKAFLLLILLARNRFSRKPRRTTTRTRHPVHTSSDAAHTAMTDADGEIVTVTTPASYAEAQELIPRLPDHLVVAHILRSEYFDDPANLARLPAVSRAMRDAVAATGLRLKELSEYEAVELGCLSALKRRQRQGRLSRRERLCEAAARVGHLEKLKMLRADGWPWDSQTCAYAARYGHLEVLQWARAKGCPWDERTCSRAARGGHLQVLQWARANGCRWGELTCWGAAKGGHLEVLQWARANGCPWEGGACALAAEGGHLEVLQWALANGCPWGADTCY